MLVVSHAAAAAVRCHGRDLALCPHLFYHFGGGQCVLHRFFIYYAGGGAYGLQPLDLAVAYRGELATGLVADLSAAPGHCRCGLGHGDRPGGELLYERIVFYPVFLSAIPWRAGGLRHRGPDLDSGAAHLGANGQSVCCAGGDERFVGASGRYGGCGGLWLCESVGGICFGAVLRPLLGGSADHRQQLRCRTA